MKNYLIWAIVIAVLAIAGILFLGRQKTAEKLPAPPAPTTSTTIRQKSVGGLPRVITLYHAGEKASMRAVALSSQLEEEEENIAVFRSYDTLDEPQMAVLYGVHSVPAIAFLSPTGKVYRIHEGNLSRDAMIRIIRSIRE